MSRGDRSLLLAAACSAASILAFASAIAARARSSSPAMAGVAIISIAPVAAALRISILKQRIAFILGC
jgi:hypothetical protein